MQLLPETRWALGRLALLAAGVASWAGCSAFPDRGAELADYQAARSAINQGPTRLVSYEEEAARELSRPERDVPLKDRVRETYRNMIGKGRNPQAARDLFQQAEAIRLAALDQRQRGDETGARDSFAQAGELYTQAGERWEDSALEHDALYYAGECLFFADQYPKAETAYERLLKEYPNSRYLDAIQPRRFAIARYWLSIDQQDPSSFVEVNLTDQELPRNDTHGHAMRVFDRIRLDDPTGKLADDATLAMAVAAFERRQYWKADDYFTDLRRTFPTSEHQFTAHFLGLKAKLSTYQGPDYSGTPLDEAEKVLTQIRKQFPAEAEREREYLARAHAEIRFRKAERQWSLAARHDQRAEARAAKFYYQMLLKDYRDTPFAARAEQRLRELGDVPDVPDQPLEWLAELFPEREPAKPLISSGGAPVRR